MSFRGFVDMLRDASSAPQAPEAPILEEGSEGVRLMTVHKAKGLEFPVVVLADIGCRLSRDDASRYLDPERGLCAMPLGGWSPLDLLEHNDEEARRDEAEGIRLAYVAATRARDLLVVPAVGDGPYRQGWVRPLNRALYPPRRPAAVAGHRARRAAVQGQETPCPMPAPTDSRSTTRCGRAPISSPIRHAASTYTVVWWDPLLLEAAPDDARGLRRDDLISKDATAADVAADRAKYDAVARAASGDAGTGRAASMRVLTATELS